MTVAREEAERAEYVCLHGQVFPLGNTKTITTFCWPKIQGCSLFSHHIKALRQHHSHYSRLTVPPKILHCRSSMKLLLGVLAVLVVLHVAHSMPVEVDQARARLQEDTQGDTQGISIVLSPPYDGTYEIATPGPDSGHDSGQYPGPDFITKITQKIVAAIIQASLDSLEDELLA